MCTCDMILLCGINLPLRACLFVVQAVVYAVDVDAAEDIAAQYNVTKLPRLIFFRGGEVVQDYHGSVESEISDK